MSLYTSKANRPMISTMKTRYGANAISKGILEPYGSIQPHEFYKIIGRIQGDDKGNDDQEIADYPKDQLTERIHLVVDQAEYDVYIVLSWHSRPPARPSR